jgi:Tfp pilus assembly protein PilF
VAPDAVTDYTLPLELARLAASRQPNVPAVLNTLGTVLYRAGQDDKAIEQLTKAIEVHGKGGTPADWLILALAHQRQGRAGEARKWLDKAVTELEKQGAEQSWSNQLELRLLRREAEARINR